MASHVATADPDTGFVAWIRTWGSTAAERRRGFPCDRYLSPVDDAVYRAIDVAAPAAVVFRWLCQMRVAPYSYDWIDNWGRQSPRHLVPGLEALAIGQSFCGVLDLVHFETGRSVTLRSKPSVFGTFAATYDAVPVDAHHCRLVVKLLVTYAAPFRPLLRPLLPTLDLIMMRRQLLNLKELAERTAASPAEALPYS